MLARRLAAARAMIAAEWLADDAVPLGSLLAPAF